LELHNPFPGLTFQFLWKNDFILLDNKTLYAYNDKGVKLFNYTFENKIEGPFTIIRFSSTDKKIAVVNKNESQIYVISSNGTLYHGFPLQGNTLFSVISTTGKDKKNGLVVGGAENFVYYYEIK